MRASWAVGPLESSLLITLVVLKKHKVLFHLIENLQIAEAILLLYFMLCLRDLSLLSNMPVQGLA